MGRKIIPLAMLKDKDATICQQILTEDQGRNLFQALQRIGWISENEVKLLVARFDEFENVSPYDNGFVGAQCGHALADECIMVAVGLHTHYLPATA